MLTLLLCTFHLLHASSYTGLGADSVSPEVLARFAPPPLARDLESRIQQMFDVRAPGAGIIDPTGKRMFFNWRVTGVSQVWRLDGPKAFPVQMTGGEDQTRAVALSPDGRRLFIARDRGGEENAGLYWQSAEGGPLVLIQHPPKVRTHLSFVTEDSKRIYFTSNDQSPDAYAIYRYDLETKEKTVVFSEPGLWSVADHLGETELLLQKSIGSAETEYYRYEVSTKTLTPLFGQGEHQDYDANFGAHPGEILVATPKFGEFRRLYSVIDGKFRALSPEIPWDVDGFAIDRARRRIYVSTNEAGLTRVSVMDARTYRPLKLPPAAAGEIQSLESLSRDGRFVTIGRQSARSPNASSVYDWRTKRSVTWVVPSVPEIDLGSFVPATLEHYPAADGTKIPMFVRRPKRCEAKACPVVVSFHGGPEGQSQPTFSVRAQLFVDAGFVFVEPNVRGSDGYGKTWFHADDGPKRLDVITDVRDCATFVRKTWAFGGTEPKVGVLGGSYGGYSVQAAMTMFPGAYDAGFSIVGISNLVSFLENTAPYRRILRINEYGDPVKDLEALKKLSPINFVDQVRAPLFLVQGLNDPRVPVGEAVQIFTALEKRKIPTSLVIFPDEGHGAGKRDNQVKQTGYALAFFEKYLK